MTTTTVDHVSVGTRVRAGYVGGSAAPSGTTPWRPVPQGFLVAFSMINNSTGVSEVECRRR